MSIPEHLECSNCRWTQDDFWEEEGYWPLYAGRLHCIKEDLFGWGAKNLCPRFPDTLPSPLDINPFEPNQEGSILAQRTIDQVLEVINSMSVPTKERWYKVSEIWVCPNCGETNTGVVVQTPRNEDPERNRLNRYIEIGKR